MPTEIYIYILDEVFAHHDFLQYTHVQRQESFSPNSCANIADDDVTAKRNDIRWLATFSVFTYI